MLQAVEWIARMKRVFQEVATDDRGFTRTSPCRSPRRVLTLGGVFLFGGPMLVVVQFPLADVRPFHATTPARLPLPTWPIPRDGIDFIRHFGPVETRRGGIGLVERWSDDLFYCRAHRALLLPDAPRTAFGDIGLAKVFRRFFSDGQAAARFEIGISVRKVRNTRDGRPLNAKGLLDVLHSVLDLPTRVPYPGSPAEACHLLLQGKALARLYFQASSPVCATPPLHPRWIPVEAGAPMVFVEYDGYEVEAVPSTARPVNISNSPGLRLDFATIGYSRGAVSAWLLGRGDSRRNAFSAWLLGRSRYPREWPETGSAVQFARNIRICLFRLHAEYQVFKQVLRLIQGGAIRYERATTEGDALERYLSSTRKWLFSAEKYGVDQAQFRELMLGFDSLVTAQEKALLLRQLEAIRPQSLRALDRDLPPRDRPTEPQPGDFDVFISYNSEDVEEVTGIVRQLQERAIGTWFDRDQVAPGTPVVRALNEVLDRVRTAVVFLGDSGLGRWQELEQEALIGQLVARECHIIPVILASATRKPLIPPLLATNSLLDLRKPSAETVRRQLWGEQLSVRLANPPRILSADAISRLCWGITGKRLDPDDCAAEGMEDVPPVYRRADSGQTQLTAPEAGRWRGPGGGLRDVGGAGRD